MKRAMSVLALAFVSLTTLSCSGGGGADDEAVASPNVLATLDVLTDTVSVVRDGSGTPEAASSGAELTQGDEVRTDETGFAEIAFFDGSWQRIDSGAAVTLTELVDVEEGHVVRTGLDQGRAWQRVEDLTNSDDSFEVDTPVAVAAVRGTSFSIECRTDPVACTFAVLEGVVDLDLSDGTTVALTAGQRLEVRADAPPEAPTDVGVEQLEEDEWIADNLARDADDPPQRPTTGTSPSSPAPSEGAAADFREQANAICTEFGEQNAAIGGPDATADDAIRAQAALLDDALAELDALAPPPELSDQFDEMLDLYRQRNEVVARALDADAAARPALVTELLVLTADGAGVGSRARHHRVRDPDRLNSGQAARRARHQHQRQDEQHQRDRAEGNRGRHPGG